MNELKIKIIQKLKAHTELNTAGVQVIVEHDLIKLEGLVDGEDARATVEGLVRSLEAQQEVINELKIRRDNISGSQGLTLK